MPTITPTNLLDLKEATSHALSVSKSVVSANSTNYTLNMFLKHQIYGDEMVEMYFSLLLPKQFSITNNFITFT